MLEATIPLLHIFLLILFLPGSIFSNVYHQFEEDKLEERRIRRQLTTIGGGNCAQQIVPNGQVSYLPSTLATQSIGTVASGTTAVLTCNSGFVPQGASAATCSNSIWNPPLGICQSSTLLGGGTTGVNNPFRISTTTLPFGQGQQCLAQMPTLNGQLQYSQAQSQIGFYPTGTIVHLICNAGSTAIGSVQSVCQLGQWQPAQLGPCQSGTNLLGTGNTVNGINTGLGTTSVTTMGGCFPAISPANGQIRYGQLPQNGVYPPGTTATLTCLNAVAPTSTNGQQSSFSTCSSGTWRPPFGQCSTTGGNFGTFGQSTASTIGTGNIFGTTNQYCLAGLLPPIGATLQYSTNNNQFGQNTLAPTTQNSLFGNSLGNTGPYPPGTTATVICQQAGSVPSGQTTSTCQNGQWVPSILPGCAGGTGTFGQTLNNNNGLTGLNTGTGQCLMGLAILGGNVIYTSTGGGLTSLSTTATTNLLGNTQISQFGPFPQGTIAQAQCLNGQQPSGGAMTATCISGHWQPPQLGSCLAANNQLFAGIGGTSSTFSPFQQQFGQSSSTMSLGLTGTSAGQQQCFFGLLPPLNGRLQYSNGQLVGPFPTGTVASMLCNTGFVPNGQASAICQNGVFTPTVLGQCTQANFNPSSSSSTFSSSLPTQSTIKSTSLNTNGPTTTNGSNGIVGNSQCFEMPSPKNGQFVYSPVGYRAPFPVGSTATLVCAENTQMADCSTVSRSAICQPNGWSQLQFDPCLPTTSSTGGTFK